MDENVYGADTQNAISEQLSSLADGAGNGDVGEIAGEQPQQQQEGSGEDMHNLEHYQPPFLRDDDDVTAEADDTYKEAQQSLESTVASTNDASNDNKNVVVASNLPNLSNAMTPTPTPPIPATEPSAVNTDATTTQLPPLPVPKDRKDSLRMQIEKDRRDADAWLDLIALLESQGRNLVGDELEAWWIEYTAVYDDFFKIWPCAVR